MAGIVPLQKLQIGRETTAGTAVAATTIWRGKAAMIEDSLQVVPVDEQIGLLSGTDRTYIPFTEGKVSMPATEASFEQLPHILEAGIKTATPAQDGVGSGYVYTYAFPTTSKNTLKTYTLEAGDDQQEEELAYAFVEKFTLEGKSKEAVMVSADWIGQAVAPSSFTSLNLATVETLLFQKTKLYIDAVGGTLGSTQVSNTMLGFKLDVTTGWHTKYTGDGTLNYSFIEAGMPEVLLEMTWEHNSSAVTEKANWRAQTARQIQLKIEGGALGTPGTSYTYKTLKINLAGKWEKFSVLGNQDGNSIVTATLRAKYNSTAALFGSLIVVNELTTLP